MKVRFVQPESAVQNQKRFVRSPSVPILEQHSDIRRKAWSFSFEAGERTASK